MFLLPVKTGEGRTGRTVIYAQTIVWPRPSHKQHEVVQTALRALRNSRDGEEAGEQRRVTHPAAQIEVPAAHLLQEREPGAQRSCLGSRLLRPDSIPRVHDPLCPTPPLTPPSSSFLPLLDALFFFFFCLFANVCLESRLCLATQPADQRTPRICTPSCVHLNHAGLGSAKFQSHHGNRQSLLLLLRRGKFWCRQEKNKQKRRQRGKGITL